LASPGLQVGNRALALTVAVVIVVAAVVVLLVSRRPVPPTARSSTARPVPPVQPTSPPLEVVTEPPPPTPSLTPVLHSATYEFRLPTVTAPVVPTAPTTPLTVAGDVRAPVLVRKVEPAYPEAMRKGRMEGTVLVEAVITERGDVVDARVVRSTHPLLDKPALSAIQQWRYEPATLDGRPVRVYVTITTTFTLH
jgi:protein TonB